MDSAPARTNGHAADGNDQEIKVKIPTLAAQGWGTLGIIVARSVCREYNPSQGRATRPLQKVPFILVMGDKEAEANAVNVRTRGSEKTQTVPFAEFLERVTKLDREKTPTL